MSKPFTARVIACAIVLAGSTAGLGSKAMAATTCTASGDALIYIAPYPPNAAGLYAYAVGGYFSMGTGCAEAIVTGSAVPEGGTPSPCVGQPSTSGYAQCNNAAAGVVRGTTTFVVQMAAVAVGASPARAVTGRAICTMTVSPGVYKTCPMTLTAV